MVIHVSLFYPLFFSSPVLEPDFDLVFRQTEQLRQFVAPGAGDILSAAVLDL